MRLIDADALRARMYHESFETDSDMQKWDSGCWIRYKLFEKCLEEQPTVQPQPSMLTVECKFDDEELAKAIEEVKKANLELIAAESHWIPVTERLPENRVAVIVCYREWQPYTKRYLYDIVIGWYARKNSVNENVFCEWDADCDYDEDDDEYYIKEGWYEFTTQGNSNRMNWFINAEVVAWQSLPELYKEEKK